MMPSQMMTGRLSTLAAGLVAVALLVACTPDPEPEAGDPPPSTTATTTEPAQSEPQIDDDCPPESDPTEVPPTWPTVPVATAGTDGGASVDLALVDVVDATCFSIAPIYAAELEVEIPEFGELITQPGAVLRYDPTGAPADLDHPEQAWWGEDRVRVCVQQSDDDRGCINIDIRVLRAEIVALQDRFGVTTIPQLSSPITRSGMRAQGATEASIASVQDAYAAEWALQLVAQTLDLPEPPLELASACDASGTDLDDLLTAGRTLLEDHHDLVDAATFVIGDQGLPPDLSARANAALAAVEAWIDCEI